MNPTASVPHPNSEPCRLVLSSRWAPVPARFGFGSEDVKSLTCIRTLKECPQQTAGSQGSGTLATQGHLHPVAGVRPTGLLQRQARDRSQFQGPAIRQQRRAAWDRPHSAWVWQTRDTLTRSAEKTDLITAWALKYMSQWTTEVYCHLPAQLNVCSQHLRRPWLLPTQKLREEN